MNARFIKPVDAEMVKKAASEYKLLVTLEENVRSGGYGEEVMEILGGMNADAKLINIAIPDCFVEHGKVDELLKELHMDSESVTKQILENL